MAEIHFLSILIVYMVTTIVLASGVYTENFAESILDYLEHGGSFQVGTQKDVVLVLSITDRSSLTSLITGAELESIADDEIKGSFDIIERHNETNELVETLQTVNLMIDERNEVSFYDCFGFNHAGNVKVELAATFALSKLLHLAKSVKFLFVISYDSIKKNKGHDFQHLIRYANGLIKHIEKYRNAIAMVVTKIPNTYVEMDDQQQLEDDATKIQSLANSLQQNKIDFLKKMLVAATNEERQVFLRYILIIDILMEKDDSGYKRIGIMRLPDRAGLLSEMPLIQSEKANILQIVKENLQYIPKENDDFGYIISNKSRAHINEVANLLNIKLITDFYKISTCIVKIFMWQKEKLSSKSLNESIITTSMIESNLSKMDSMEPKQFLKQLTETIDTLGVTLPIKELKKFSKHIFYLDFVQLFSTNNFTIPNEIFYEIVEVRDYLNNSQLWYSFLIKLHEKLSEFRVQKQKHDYDGSKIMNLITTCEHIERKVSDLDIKSTIDPIDPQLYEQIQHVMYINLWKMKLLQGVWEQSMQPAVKNCSSNGEQLTVHGYNVLISDVIQSVCWPQAKHIEIFALNKVFFDANIEKAAIYLSIISPAWEIVSQGNVTSRQIKLIGVDGLNYPAPADNGTNLDGWDMIGHNGEDLTDHLNKGRKGFPGVSGGQGGQFFGISQSVNENRLEILVNGGKGGDGQDGGDGVDGTDGENVPPKKDYQDLIAMGLRCATPITLHNGKYYTVNHMFCGTPATAGTDGGEGGCKGSGGKSGLVQIFGLTNKANILSIERNGENGKDGKGGLGGKGAENGKDYHIKIKYRAFNSIFDIPSIQPELSREMWYNDTGTKPAGKTGTDGGNCYEIGGGNFNFSNPLKSLRQYKYFARTYLSENVEVSDLIGFLNHLGTNVAIKSLFSTIDFIEDFETIDKLFKVHNRFSFIPYYERLRGRIVAYSQTTVIGKEEEKALNYLYTAVSSRLFTIKSDYNHIGIVNLYEYMKIVEKRMIKLQQVKRTVYINEYRDEFKSSLDTKIDAANELVQNTVVARINGMFIEVDKKINELLVETNAMEIEARDQTEKAKENRQKLKKQIIARGVLKSLNLVGSMLSVLGPVGMIAGKVIESGTNATEKAINSTLKMHTITVPTGLVKSNVLRVTQQAKRDFQLLKLQLGDLRTVLQNSNLSDFSEILKTVNLSAIEMEKDAEKITENLKLPSIDRFKFLDAARKNLTSLIEDAKQKLEGFGNKGSKLVKFAKKSLDFMGNIMRVGGAGLEVYQQIRDDAKKIAEVDETIQELNDQLNTIKQHEKNIYNVMIPQFKMVEQSVSEAIYNSAGKSHCELIISNWTVQSSLDKVKGLFKLMAQDFEAGKDLEDCLDRINDGITTVMDVYDRIDAYTEKAQMAELIADIAIGSNEIKDTKLRNAILKMDRVITANLAMEQYEMAMYALKQHKFPFADQYLGQFELPSNYSTTDTEFTNSAINQISELVLKIRESKSLIERIDGYLYNNHHFVNHEAFFKWDRFNYKNEINNLLSGEETTFVADIKSGSQLNAVKFNEVWLKFKMKNDTVQRQFDAEFHKFSVVMQMMGNNFYRCAKRIYYISLENPFLISYSLENGRVSSPNQVYGKLATGDAFLSPYSSWRISLRSKTDNEIDFKRLRQFRSYIKEIALEGRGQFLDNKGDIVYETCTDHLDKYYRLDSVASFESFK